MKKEAGFSKRISEKHKSHRVGWLRAAVLGANDGLVSTASLIVGVAAANVSHGNMMISGLAGLVAGAMSMAAGEYVSVSSQADAEAADLEIEKRELATENEAEHKELADIYVDRGLEPKLAKTVADQLMEHDALGAHARDELGISEVTVAKPLQAAVTSAITFAVGAALPLALAYLLPTKHLIVGICAGSLVFLAALGAVAAYTGGASLLKGALRVTVWGALAMAATVAIGTYFGAVV